MPMPASYHIGRRLRSAVVSQYLIRWRTSLSDNDINCSGKFAEKLSSAWGGLYTPLPAYH